MLFNSFAFVFFFPLVVTIFFATPHRWRWAVLLAASYWFYGSWRPEYLLLLMASTGVDYWAALRMETAGTQARRKAWLGVSLAGNLGMLGYFKYAGFLADSLRAALAPLGLSLPDSPALHPLLPVGISFYVFQTLAYSIDVYRGTIPAERHLGRFALYVAFFPQLVAGPIERAGSLLPQFTEVKRFHGGRVVSGLTRMGWGFFQKLVIADRLAPFVNEVFAGGGAPQTAGAVLLASYCFYFQIYADFSGYTDIAIGSARVMGFQLAENFDRAYLSRTVSEQWRRWHMTLMSWFRDYLMRPLGFSRPGRPRWMRNILIVFLVSGLWHGAAWTFAAWGLANAVFVITGDSTRRRRDRLWERAADALSRRWAGAGRLLLGARSVMQPVLVFNLMALSLIFFRAPSIGRALEMFGTLFGSPGTLLSLNALPLPPYQLMVAAAAITLFLLVDGWGRVRQWPERFSLQPRWMRWSLAYAVGLAVLMFGEFNLTEFFYFQF
jgi:alginate O-acetyltransferase complex protein AlgI